MKAICLLIYLSTCLQSYSQKVFVETSHSRIIYCGIDNKIVIHVDGFRIEQLRPEVNTGELNKTDTNGVYIWKICSPFIKKAILKIFADGKPIDSILFQIELPPIPKVFIPNNGHRSSAGDIYRKGIYAVVENFFIKDFPIEVVSFEIGIKYKNVDTFIVHQNEGAKLDRTAKELFGKLTPGGEYYVTKIDLKVGCREDHVLNQEIFFRKLY